MDKEEVEVVEGGQISSESLANYGSLLRELPAPLEEARHSLVGSAAIAYLLLWIGSRKLRRRSRERP